MEFSQQTVQDLIQNKMQVLFLCTISLRVKPFSSEFHNKEQTQKSSNKHVRIRLFLHRYKFQGELNMELWLCYSCWETEWSLHPSSGEQSIKSRGQMTQHGSYTSRHIILLIVNILCFLLRALKRYFVTLIDQFSNVIHVFYHCHGFSLPYFLFYHHKWGNLTHVYTEYLWHKMHKLFVYRDFYCTKNLKRTLQKLVYWEWTQHTSYCPHDKIYLVYNLQFIYM